MLCKKPDSATQWNKEDKPSLDGKQEQSMALDTAPRTRLGCACVTGSSTLQLILQARTLEIKGERWTLVRTKYSQHFQAALGAVLLFSSLAQSNIPLFFKTIWESEALRNDALYAAVKMEPVEQSSPSLGPDALAFRGTDSPLI